MSETPELNTQSGHQPTKDIPRDDGREETTPVTRWPWPAQLLFALVIIVAIVVLLVGLPTASLLVVERVSSGNGLLGTVSFWGASFAAFISLVVVFIGGVFAFTAFKVEGNAAQEARKTAREEARYTVKRQVESIIIETAREYLEEEVYDGSGDGKNGYTRGQKAARHAADDYLKKNGDKISREAANDNAKEYVDNHGSEITQKAAVAYVDNNGERITGERADIYIRENVESDGQKQPRGEKVARQVVDGYVRNVVDDYASEDPDDKGETRVETMTRETVEKISADEVARLVDKYLASLRLVDRLRISFRRGGRHDEG